MNNIIDIHTHIIPGIDDGARNLDSTMKMLSIAYREGIRSMIVTPHYDGRYFFNTKEIIRDSINEILPLIKKTYPDLSVYPGCELFYSYDNMKKIDEGQIQTLADSRYLLVEFPIDVTPGMLKRSMEEIIYKGYHPIVAHVERYSYIINEVDMLFLLKNMGVSMQMNASFITDSSFTNKRTMIKLIKENIIDFIATDAHSSGRRAPVIQKCALYLERKFGTELAEQLMIKNPLKIIQDAD